MTHSIIVCNGFTINNLSVPAFALHQNEIVALIWPLDKGHPSEAGVIDILTGDKKHPRVHITGTIAEATRPRFYRTIFGSPNLARIIDKFIPYKLKTRYYKSLRWRYAIKYRGRFSVLSNQEEEEVRRSLQLTPQNSLDAIQGTKLALLGLTMAYDRSDAVIFDTVGCTPQSMYKDIMLRLSKSKAAIEIAYPKISDSSPYPDVYPEAKRIIVETYFNSTRLTNGF